MRFVLNDIKLKLKCYPVISRLIKAHWINSGRRQIRSRRNKPNICDIAYQNDFEQSVPL